MDGEQQATVTLRGCNLTNVFYGEYSGYLATNIYIGARAARMDRNTGLRR
jgi:hypothetical protein